MNTNSKLNTTAPTPEQIAAAPVVTPGTCAFISGTRRTDTRRGVDITPLFQFNNVWDMVNTRRHNGRELDATEQAEYIEQYATRYAAGDLMFAPYWANPLPGVIYGKGYDAQRKMDAERNAQALRLAVGDYVIMRGVVLQIVKAPNDNVWLVEVAQVPVVEVAEQVEVAGEPAPQPAAAAPVTTNRIIGVELTPTPSGGWSVAVIKEFAPENGGGVQVFTEPAPNLHRALDVAREMVTFSPARVVGLLEDTKTVPADYAPVQESPTRSVTNPVVPAVAASAQGVR